MKKSKGNAPSLITPKLTISALSVAIALSHGSAIADPGGRLIFLGWTTDLQRSVWLSAVRPGVYDLKYPQAGNVTIDFWTQEKRGLRLTVSPYREEYGGTHNLFTQITTQYSTYENFVDSADQRPGRPTLPNTFPPPGWPSLPPQPEVPDAPQGLTPAMPGGTAPPIGSLPSAPGGITPTIPGGVAPPVATLPPQGVTPGVPAAVVPPVGSRPPISGLTPGASGGIAPPIATLPPQGLTPNVPGGVAPPIGGVPPITGITPGAPGGIAPPIATLPPQGITPGVPGGVSPPIGNRPPISGITPTVPGGVAPPITSLPPSGITPTVPGGVSPPIATRPPQGITPGLPSSVSPPVGTLPPVSGLTPTVPGGIAPPIGVLPPSGLTPTVPGSVTPPIGALPPSGLMPTAPDLGARLPTFPRDDFARPGGITPPIATLPPAGITPKVPNVVSPPIGSLPPVNGLTPGVAGGITAPIASLPSSPNGLTPTIPGGTVPPIAMLPPSGGVTESVRPPIVTLPPSQQISTQVESAVTTERKLAADHGWNVWLDTTYYNVTEHRKNSDMSGSTTSLTMGADKRIDAKTTVGFVYGRQDAHGSIYDGDLRLKSNGYSIGPYMAYQFSERWMFDGTVTYGRMNNRRDILMLSGTYDTETYAASVGVSGQYWWDATSVRPRFGIDYSHTKADSSLMSGVVAGTPLQLIMKGGSASYGTFTSEIDFSRVYYTSQGKPVMPYINLELDYAFHRPNDEDPLSGDISSSRPSAFTGAARFGVRTLLSPATSLTMSAGYLSIGQKGQNISEWRIYLSHAF